MILRPQRYRILLGFLAGLSLSVIIIGASYLYYRNNTYQLAEQEKLEIRRMAVEEYIQNNPTSLVYTVTTDKSQERFYWIKILLLPK